MRWGILPSSLLTFLLLSQPDPSSAFYHSDRRAALRELTRQTFHHAYNSYKRVAFPADEVLPISCRPQGHDRAHPENVGVNDVMGDYVLTLVDSLDTFAIMGDREGFENGVREIIQHVSFDKDSRVQVFEVTIRCLGGLLSGHILATNPKKGFALLWYKGEMLALARDLGRRLLPAFNTPTGIPYPRVHLQHGVRKLETTETCSAGAGSLLLEFATLSRLTGDTVFEEVARKAFFATWNRRSEIDLIGNTINAFDGRWMHGVSSTGAGIDSFFEYGAKAYVMLGDDEWWRVWEDAYLAIMKYIRAPDGFWYRGANMNSGHLASVLVDSLSAFFPGVQTLVGDLDAAIKSHAVYAFQWKRYAGLPELFDINRRMAASPGYPLRPEFIESNLYLYQATKDDFYLEIAEQVLHDINNRTRVECGFAAIKDLNTGLLEDKMPSFFTSETLKYLYLTFDVDNQFNHDDSNSVYSTEGHMLEVDARPLSNRRRRSLAASAPVCLAYTPSLNTRTQHFLSSSVACRTDFEYARYLAGFVVGDTEREVAEGRWSESGFCEVPVSEAYGVELLFAASGAGEDVAPRPSKVRQGRDGTVFISAIAGLRFSLTRSGPGADSFLVSRVAQYRVPTGSLVQISDPAVLAGVRVSRVEKIQLNFSVVTSAGEKTLHAPGFAASFGPSVASRTPPAGSFAVSLPALPLFTSPFQYGCEPSRDAKSQVMGKVLVVRRGVCSFARKAHLAALDGAKAVLVVNTSDEDDLVPSMDDEDRHLQGLVPLVLVSNATGGQLEALLLASTGVARVKPEETDDYLEEPLLLGGYHVLNVRLQRS